LTGDIPASLQVNFQDMQSLPDGVLLSTSNVADSYSIGMTKLNEKITVGFFNSPSEDSNLNLLQSLPLSNFFQCSSI
jgi:hypothetical protein